MPIIEIQYDGKYPNLCSGSLVVIIDGVQYPFPDNCLGSGGYMSFDVDGNELVIKGEWGISEYPKNFPRHLKI